MTAPTPQRAASAEEHTVPTGFARLVSNLIHEAFDGVDPVPPHVEAAIDRMEVALIGIVNADREASATMEAGAMRVVAEALEHWSTFLSKSNGIQEWVRQAVGALNYARKREAEFAPLLDRITAAEARAEEAERERDDARCVGEALARAADANLEAVEAATADRDRLADEVARLRGGWQPIETAPLNGTKVDVWDGTYRRPDCHWTGDHWVQPSDRRRGVACFVSGFNPTHWMRPPRPPIARALTATGGTTDGQA